MSAITLLLVIALQVGAPTAAAQGRNVAWNRYDVDLDVQPDGSVQVTETQTIHFQGTYQQGFRVIPTDRVTRIDDVAVARRPAARRCRLDRALCRRATAAAPHV